MEEMIKKGIKKEKLYTEIKMENGKKKESMKET